MSVIVPCVLYITPCPSHPSTYTVLVKTFTRRFYSIEMDPQLDTTSVSVGEKLREFFREYPVRLIRPPRQLSDADIPLLKDGSVLLLALIPRPG